MTSRSGRKATRSWGGRPQKSLSSSALARPVDTFSGRKTVARPMSSRGSSDSRPGFHAPNSGAAVNASSRAAARPCSRTGADVMAMASRYAPRARGSIAAPAAVAPAHHDGAAHGGAAEGGDQSEQQENEGCGGRAIRQDEIAQPGGIEPDQAGEHQQGGVYADREI